MTESAPQLAPIGQSPLRMTNKNRELRGVDPAGGLVVFGTLGGPGPLDAMTIQTHDGAWRIQRRADSENEVLDAAGQHVGTLQHRFMRSTLIALAGGEEIPVTTGRLRLFGIGCRVGHLASARAPFFSPGRYFTLTLHDGLLERPDRAMVLALGAYVADRVIKARIQDAAMSQSP